MSYPFLQNRMSKISQSIQKDGISLASEMVEKVHIDETEYSADPRTQFSLPNAAGKERTHTHTIRLKLHDMNQLFNSMDPSPFIERDLDDDAEEFIVSWAQECPSNASIRLRIYLDQWPAEDPKELIKTAVHNHFSHRVQIARLEFKRLLEQGRTSLFIGLLVPGRMSASHQPIARARCGHMGSRRARESHDCRMGGHVATDADLSLRLVAAAATNPDLYQAESHASRSVAESKA